MRERCHHVSYFSKNPMSQWITAVSIFSLTIAGVGFLAISTDLLRRPQKMWIMNLVWPLTALYAGQLAVLLYFKIGRLSSQRAIDIADQERRDHSGRDKPFWQAVAIGAMHCGSGCVLGDLVAESITLRAPVTIFGQKLLGDWVIDYLWAYLFGIVFQYFSIKPMKGLSMGHAIWAAIKADTLSLTAWQFGMYGWMAIATFLIFGHEISKTSAVFWFMMQIAMLFGFCTAYPMNWWLIKSGVKEKM